MAKWALADSSKLTQLFIPENERFPIQSDNHQLWLISLNVMRIFSQTFIDRILYSPICFL